MLCRGWKPISKQLEMVHFVTWMERYSVPLMLFLGCLRKFLKGKVRVGISILVLGFYRIFFSFK